MLKRALRALITRLRGHQEPPDLDQMRLAISNHRAQTGGPDERRGA